MTKLLIGTKNNNIFSKMKTSLKCRLVFVICFIYSFKTLERGMDLLSCAVASLFVAFLIINILYIPGRLLMSKIDTDIKLVFVLILTIIAGRTIFNSNDISIMFIFNKLVSSIIYSLLLTFLIWTLVKNWKVHAKNVKFHTRRKTDIDKMNGHEFEKYCSIWLQNRGFQKIIVTKGSGDHGVDILAMKEGVSYAFQCKRYQGNVGNSAVQQVFTGSRLYKASVAVVITNSYFSKQAREEARALGVKLFDRDTLLKYK